MSEDRKRDAHTDPGGTGVRWFRLDADLAANSSALAYAVRWNGSAWSGNLSATRTRIYSGPHNAIAADDDYVQCVYMPTNRHWEVIGLWEHWGWARLVADLNSLSSTTATVWRDTAASNTMANTGIVITVHDRLLASASAIATLTRVRWEYQPRTGKYYVVNAACDPDTSPTVWGT